MSMRGSDKVVVMIASPLEAEHATRIARVDPARIELIYRPDLLPPTRYVADHDGPPHWRRSSAAQAEWRAAPARGGALGSTEGRRRERA